MPWKAEVKIMEINATLDFARKKFRGRQRKSTSKFGLLFDLNIREK
jgi:hypothetical protein